MPLRNVATNYTFEQQRQEINLLAADVDAIANQQGTETTDSPTFNSIFLGSTLYGPTLFTIDPATHGDDTGTLVIKGNLQIDGTTTTVNSTIMSVNDLNITLADGASNAAAADGAGLTVDGSGATLLYNGTTDEWEFNKSLRLSGNIFCTNVEPSNNIQLLNDKKLLVGTASELQIYHDGTHSRIVDNRDSGTLRLQADNFKLIDKDAGETMISAVVDGAVELYHNNSKKFETTSSGVAIIDQLTIGSGSAANASYGLIAYANADSLSNKSAVYARNIGGGRNFTGDNAAGATTFELYASGQGNFGAASNSTNSNGVLVGGNNGTLNIYTDRYATDCFQILNTSGSGTNIALKAYGNGNLEMAGTISDSIGPLRRLGVTGVASSGNLSANDAGKLLRSTGNGSALTIPQNVFSAGDMISIFNVSTGDNTIVQGSGATLYNTADGATGNRTLGPKGVCTILCTSTNEFIISGSQIS